MRGLLFLFLVGLVGLGAPSLAREPTVIEVFTQAPAKMPAIPSTRIIHYDLSEAERVQDQLPRVSLKNEREARARQAAIQADLAEWLQSPQGRMYQERVRAAYAGHMKAMEYQLEKAPAVVFDGGSHVVYGTTNVKRALLLYRQQAR